MDRGEGEPVATNDTRAGRLQNRRVVIAMFAERGDVGLASAADRRRVPVGRHSRMWPHHCDRFSITDTHGPGDGVRSMLTEPEHATPAIVLGDTITALGVMRRMAKLGVRSYVTSRQPGFERASRWYHRAPGLDGPPEPGGLETWLSRVALERAVLFPCSDEALVEVAGLSEETKCRFRASVPPLATATALVDKSSLAHLLAAAQIAHPTTVELKRREDLARVSDAVLSCSFLKPAQSQAFCRAFNVKALHIDGRRSAEEQLDRVLSRGFEVVLQEMIPGPATNQVCIDGFIDREGRTRARFARRWLRKLPADFGESSLAVSIPLAEVAEAVELAERALGLLPYRGFFSVELKKHEGDGRYRVLEVNTRPWWYIGFTCAAGIDMCAMAYADALDRPVEDAGPYRIGMHVAYPTLDWHARLRAPPSERESLPKAIATWLSAVQPIFSWSDPGPSLADIGRRLGARAQLVLGGGRRQDGPRGLELTDAGGGPA